MVPLDRAGTSLRSVLDSDARRKGAAMAKLLSPFTAVAVLVVPALLAGCTEDLRSVEDRLDTAWQQHKSITAKVTIDYSNEQQGTMTKGHAEGTYQLMRTDGKRLLRLDTVDQAATQAGNKSNERDRRLTVVMDGEHTYTLVEANGKVSVLKRKADADSSLGPRALFRQLGQTYTLKLLGRETIDGQSVYVIEATPKKQAGPAFSRVLYYYRPDGVLLKQVNFATDGKPMHTATFMDVRLNVKLDPEHFVFKPPPDATIIEPAAPSSAPVVRRPRF